MPTTAFLPNIANHDAFAAYFANADAGLDAVRAIAKRHGFAAGEVKRFPTGAMLVFRIGAAHVLKLYPALYKRKYAVEKASLQLVANQLPIVTPVIVADGELDGWFYLAMTALPGEPIDVIFDEINPPARVPLLRQLGVAVARLHKIEIPNGSPLRHSWDDYVTAQIGGAAARQRLLGLDEHYVEQIPKFLARFERELRASDACALLHTELGPSHLLLERTGDAWEIGGLFDFGDAFRGPAEFDFPAVALFVAQGERALFREFLRAYGAPIDATGTAGLFHERMLAYALIHKYSNLAWYRKEFAVNAADGRLESLAAGWFDVS